LGDEAFQSNGESAFGWHAIAESLQKLGKGRFGHTARRQRRAVVLVAVQALTARYQLRPANNQIEGVRELRPLRDRIAVEWTLTDRIAGDIEKVATILSLRPLAQPALVLRREVWLAT